MRLGSLNFFVIHLNSTSTLQQVLQLWKMSGSVATNNGKSYNLEHYRVPKNPCINHWTFRLSYCFGRSRKHRPSLQVLYLKPRKEWTFTNRKQIHSRFFGEICQISNLKSHGFYSLIRQDTSCSSGILGRQLPSIAGEKLLAGQLLLEPWGWHVLLLKGLLFLGEIGAWTPCLFFGFKKGKKDIIYIIIIYPPLN